MEAFIPSSYFETVRRETPSSVARRPSDQPRSLALVGQQVAVEADVDPPGPRR